MAKLEERIGKLEAVVAPMAKAYRRPNSKTRM
jgi:hypothetical protein